MSKYTKEDFVLGVQEDISALALVEAIESSSDFLEWCDAYREATKEKKNCTLQKQKSTVDLRKELKQISAQFDPALKMLEKRQDLAKKLLIDYIESTDAQIAQALEEINECQDPQDRQLLETYLEGLQLPDVPGLSISLQQSGAVIDAAQIPREYLVPNLPLLMKTTKEAEGDVSIPGWTPKKKIVLTVRKTKNEKEV